MIEATQQKKPRRSYSWRGPIYEFYKNRTLTLMVLPAVLFVFLFSYIPMAGIVIAFKNYTYSKGIFGSDWVGMDNFKFFLVSGSALRVTFNTVAYNVAFTVIDIILQITVAIILSEIVGKYFIKIMQTVILLPIFVSWVVAGAIVYNLLNYDTGVVNNFLMLLVHHKVDIMNNPNYWPLIIVLFHVWKVVGWGSVIYLSAIAGLNKEMYEAAEIDGAGIYQQIFKITLPNLKPIVITLVLLGLGNIVKGDFAMFYNLTGNNPLLYDVSDIVDTFVYRSLMQSQDFGMSAAAGIYQSVLGFIIIITVNHIVKKVEPDYALF